MRDAPSNQGGNNKAGRGALGGSRIRSQRERSNERNETLQRTMKIIDQFAAASGSEGGGKRKGIAELQRD